MFWYFFSNIDIGKKSEANFTPRSALSLDTFRALTTSFPWTYRLPRVIVPLVWFLLDLAMSFFCIPFDEEGLSFVMLVFSLCVLGLVLAVFGAEGST